MNDLTKIEAKLLAAELKVLNERLRCIGDDLADAFAKYGSMNTHAEDVRRYFLNHAIKANHTYSHLAAPRIDASTIKLPDVLKEAILTWAVDDFFNKFNEVSNLMEEQ